MTEYKGKKRILVWAAILFYGPEQLYFIEEKENTDVYQEILDECLSDITILMNRELMFVRG